MKIRERRAREYARDNGEAQNEKVISAHLAGFSEGIEMAIGLLNDLNQSESLRFTILLRACNTAQVDEIEVKS